MNDIQDDLNIRLEEFDFCDIVYQVFPKEGLGYQSGDPHYKRRRTYRISSQYPILSTSPDKKQFLKEMQVALAKSHVVLDDLFLNGKWPEDFITMPYSQENELFISERDRLLQAYQVVSEATLFVTFPEDEFTGYFAVYSRLEQQELMNRLGQPFVKVALQMCHFYMTRTYPTLTHPMLFNGSIKAKTIQVIVLLSQGWSFKEVALKLALTERGVIYHYNRLREQFGAKNKAELIRLLKEHCIL